MAIRTSPAFLNAVCCAETDRSPQAVLAEMQRIEHRFGRQRHIHWGPRARSIWICTLMGDIRLNDSSKLALPHPHIGERDFVPRSASADRAQTCANPNTGQSYAHELRDNSRSPRASSSREFHMWGS